MGYELLKAHFDHLVTCCGGQRVGRSSLKESVFVCVHTLGSIAHGAFPSTLIVRSVIDARRDFVVGFGLGRTPIQYDMLADICDYCIQVPLSIRTEKVKHFYVNKFNNYRKVVQQSRTYHCRRRATPPHPKTPATWSKEMGSEKSAGFSDIGGE